MGFLLLAVFFLLILIMNILSLLLLQLIIYPFYVINYSFKFSISAMSYEG